MIVEGVYNYTLVTLSVVIAIIAAYTALDLTGRVADTVGWSRAAYLSFAAISMGGGIWAMHSVGMLALHLPQIEIEYDPIRTFAALVVAILSSGVSFGLVYTRKRSWWVFVLASVFMGGGIGAMHFIGISALQMNAGTLYNIPMTILSTLVAVGASSLALWLSSRPTYGGPARVAAAIALGLAVSCMHYLGMNAVSFYPKICNIVAGHLNQTQLALGISVATLLILFIVLAVAILDRRFAQLVVREAAVLRDSEETFRTLYTLTPSPLLSLAPDGSITQVTDAWLMLMRYSREEVVGRLFVNFFNGESAQHHLQVDFPILQQCGELREMEYRAITKTGDILDVVVSMLAERDADKQIKRVLAAVVNVTDRKRVEKSLRTSQKNEVVGQLTGGVAHEFNNALTVIIGNLELLGKRVGDDARSVRYVEASLAMAKRGADLTDRMLSFARRQEMRIANIDLPSMVRDIAPLLNKSVGPMIEIETSFPITLPPARVDASHLQTALLNLVLNSRDALPNGGTIQLSATEEALGTRKDDLQAGRYICLRVKDDGIGMDTATIERAAEPFFTTKGLGTGAGLGLSMVHGMAGQLNGSLKLYSRLGAGTIAELWLPIDEAIDVSPQIATPEIVRVAPRTILVVDDDDLVLQNTTALLEDLGHHIFPAISGEDALAVLAKKGEVIDMIVTDQAMPKMVGTQFAAAARVHRPDMPILIVTGYSQLPNGCTFPRLGKPFTQAELSQAVSDLLKAHGLRDPADDPAPTGGSTDGSPPMLRVVS